MNATNETVPLLSMQTAMDTGAMIVSALGGRERLIGIVAHVVMALLAVLAAHRFFYFVLIMIRIGNEALRALSNGLLALGLGLAAFMLYERMYASAAAAIDARLAQSAAALHHETPPNTLVEANTTTTSWVSTMAAALGKQLWG